MAEALFREQMAKVAEWEFSNILLGIFNGIDGTKAAGAVRKFKEEYVRRLTGESYVAASILRVLNEKLRASRSDLEMLRRLEEMTVPDDGDAVAK